MESYKIKLFLLELLNDDDKWESVDLLLTSFTRYFMLMSLY